MAFLVSTTLVAVIKRENEHGRGKRRVPEETQGVMETYKLLFSIIKMPTVFTFCVLLLTAKVLDHYLINIWFTFGNITCESVLLLLRCELKMVLFLCVSDWLLCSRCSDRPEAGGGWSSQGAAGIAGSAHGASADPTSCDHQ